MRFLMRLKMLNTMLQSIKSGVFIERISKSKQ